jgi:uncharacterized protein involved in exopolysaccharide biosynthesis
MQQSTYEERLRQLQQEEVSLQRKRAAIEQILATPGGQAQTADEQTLADLRRLLAEQQAIFSDDSPNLGMLRARIAELEKRLSEKHADPEDISQRSDISPELRIQFADINGQLDFVATEKETIQKTIAGLARSIADTETNSTILSALERAYETAQAQHNEAVSKLAQASTGQRIETEAVGEKLTLIEPATPPRKPVWPRRRAIALGSLVAGIGFGLGLVVLVEFWKASIRRPADLAFAFDGQPFATIPYISSRGKLIRSVSLLALLLALLAAVPGIQIASKYLPASIGTALSSTLNGLGASHSM